MNTEKSNFLVSESDPHHNIIVKAKVNKCILDNKMMSSVQMRASEIEAELLRRLIRNIPGAVSRLSLVETDEGWELKLRDE